MKLQSSLVYRKGSVIGIDIGSHTAKLAQVRRSGKGIEVLVYGHVDFAPETIVEGVVVDPDSLAATIKPLLAQTIHGGSHKVVTSLPSPPSASLSCRMPVCRAVSRARSHVFFAMRWW